jgi:hypothetical protein
MASKKKPSKSKPKKKSASASSAPKRAPIPTIIVQAPPPPKVVKPEGPQYEDARLFLEMVGLTFTPHFATARDWYLGRFEAKDLTDFRTRYSDDSEESARFWTVSGWFETAGVLMKNRLLNPDLFFDRFAVGPFWNKAKVVVHGLQKETGMKELFENYEWLVRKEQAWHKGREKA